MYVRLPAFLASLWDLSLAGDSQIIIIILGYRIANFALAECIGVGLFLEMSSLSFPPPISRKTWGCRRKVRLDAGNSDEVKRKQQKINVL